MLSKKRSLFQEIDEEIQQNERLRRKKRYVVIDHVMNITSVIPCVFLAAMREDHVRQKDFVKTLEEKSNLDFFKVLRVSRASFSTILDIIENAYGASPSGTDMFLGPKISVYLTLWYLGHEVTYIQLSELFGYSIRTIHDSVQKIIAVLNSVATEYIKWPVGDAQTQVEREFFALAGIPGCIGAIDGSHISVKAPTEMQSDYLDRTLRHSVNLMAVCDSQKRFTFINAGFPGSAHDSWVYRDTQLYQRLSTEPNTVFQSNERHMIGDSAFPIHNHLLVPFRNTGNLAPHEIRYNVRHARTRVVIENAFALAKGRFRKLKFIDADIGRVRYLVTAACVLHNISLCPDDLMLLAAEIPEVLANQVEHPLPDISRNRQGEIKRRAIALSL